MPGELLRARASIGRPGDPDPLAVTGQVILAIVEVISKAPTYLKPVFRRHSDIASIKQYVEVASKEQAIVQTVLAALSERSNMRRLEHGQRLLARHGAFSLVGIHDHDLE